MSSANAKRKNIRPSANKVQKKALKYMLALEAENEKLRTDPETALGQIIPQLREAVGQNKRLSVLAAAIISHQGGKVTITKELLEAFETKVLSIKWELPEGVTDYASATEYVFTYEALTQEEAAARQPQMTVTPAEIAGETTVETFDPSVELLDPTPEEMLEIEEIRSSLQGEIAEGQQSEDIADANVANVIAEEKESPEIFAGVDFSSTGETVAFATTAEVADVEELEAVDVDL